MTPVARPQHRHRFLWGKRQLDEIRVEKAALGPLPPNSPGWKLAVWPLTIGTLVVAAKNLLLAHGPLWPLTTAFLAGENVQLVVRNAVLAAPLLALVLLGGTASGNADRRRRLLGLPVRGWAPVPTLALGSLTVGLAASALLSKSRVVAVLALLASLGVLAAACWPRHIRESEPGTVRWTFVPPWLVIAVGAGAAILTGEVETPWARLAALLIGTALLEELIFRGALLSAAIRSERFLARVLLPGLAFGFWHFTDALHDADEHAEWSGVLQVLFVGGTVIAMAMASWLVLEPLRLRSRSIIGPVLVHAGFNGSLIALGISKI